MASTILPELPSLPTLDSSASQSRGSSDKTPSLDPFALDQYALFGQGPLTPPVLSDSDAKTVDAATKNPNDSWLNFGRVAPFVVGIILIGVGVLLFKQTQLVIQSGVKTGKRVAEIAAL